MATIKSRESGIAHCPLSNLYFSHSVFPTRKALDFGLKVGLGTDISGGPSPSILHNCQSAVNVSRALEDGVDPVAAAGKEDHPTPGSIFVRRSGWQPLEAHEALGLKVGEFTEGYQFDALLVDTGVRDSNLLIWDGMDTPDDILQKIINNAGRHNIAKVWVQGRLVRDS